MINATASGSAFLEPRVLITAHHSSPRLLHQPPVDAWLSCFDLHPSSKPSANDHQTRLSFGTKLLHTLLAIPLVEKGFSLVVTICCQFFAGARLAVWEEVVENRACSVIGSGWEEWNGRRETRIVAADFSLFV